MDTETRNFQERVEQAASCSGAGTELVTVWIPPGKNLDSTRSRLKGESAEAENIKSKKTRDRVIGALGKVLNVLHKYDTVPENGLVICAGYLRNAEEYAVFVFDDLPKPIADSKYECADSFELQGLQEMAFGGKEWWGLITVTRDSASIGRYSNTARDYVDVIDSFESHVQGKFKAGGQSAQRFARLREKQQQEHYKKVVRIAKSHFRDEDCKGIAIGGPNVTVGDFIDWLPSSLEQAIVTIETVDHAGSRESLTTLAQRAEVAFSEEERVKEQELIERFKSRLRDGSGATYGKESVDKAITFGAVDTLLISADLSSTVINERRDAVEDMGGEVVVVSTAHELGRQVDMVFGGEAALLRFDIE